MFIVGLALGLGLSGLSLLSKSLFRVDEGHLAVVTRFGAARYRDVTKLLLQTYGPGLHWKLPWEHTITVSMKEQNLALAGQEGGRSAMADDGTVLRFDSILRYVPLENELHTYLFGMKQPLEHITWLFTCLLRNEIANFRQRSEAPTPDAGMGSYALIRRERARLNEELERFTREQVGGRYGVEFRAVDLIDILPPDELADALNAVIHAQADNEARYFRAEADCSQRLLSAQQGVAIARARAEAVETEIRTLGTFLTRLATNGTLEHYVARRRAEVLGEARTQYVKESR